MKVEEVMTTDVVTCSPDARLIDVAKLMQRENFGACPVVQNDQLVGIITDRDITVRAVAVGADVNQKTVSSIMTPKPITADPDMDIDDAARLMANNQIRRLPIVEGNKLIGIVALADLAIDVDEEEMLAETLEKISEPTY